MAVAASCFSLRQIVNKEDTAENALVEYRNRIDAIDKQIVTLLNERAKIAVAIGRIRRREQTPESLTQKRAEQVLRNAMAHSEAPLTAEAVKRIYEQIMAEMVAMQKLDSEKEK
jgi:chorismate mutase/prephenate dehydratase